MSELSRDIEDRAPVLVDQILSHVYEDPFWSERFGSRGRFYMERDTLRTLSYLTQSLRFDSPEIIVNYTGWLQVVLTTRGMCTKHIADHFGLLIDALADSDITAPDRAIEFIEEALDRLVYESGPARELQLEADEIINRAVHQMESLHRASGDMARLYTDISLHLSYLADSLALERPDLYAAYASWIVTFYERHDRPAPYADRLLASLVGALQYLPVPEQEAARRQLRIAQSAITRPVAG